MIVVVAVLLLLCAATDATLVNCGTSYTTACDTGTNPAAVWCNLRTPPCGCIREPVADTAQCASQASFAVFPTITAQRPNTWTLSSDNSSTTLRVRAGETVNAALPPNQFMVSAVISNNHGTDDLQFVNLSLAPSFQSFSAAGKSLYGVQVRVWMRSDQRDVLAGAQGNVVCYAGDIELRHASLASEERGSTGSGPKVVVPTQWTLLTFGSRIDAWDFADISWFDDLFYFEVDLTAAVLFPNGTRVPGDPAPTNTVQCQVGPADIVVFYGDDEVVATRQSVALVDSSQVWQYGVHGDAASASSAPPNGWQLPSFDMLADAVNWKSGAGHFGFGDSDITVTLPSRRQTAYFRTVFAVSADDLMCSGDIHLRIRFNDGVVVYLNGAVIWNNNVDMQLPRSYESNSIRTLGRADEYRTVTLGPGHLQLVAGENLLAIEVRQSATTSSNDLHLQANMFLYRLVSCQSSSLTTTTTKKTVVVSTPSSTPVLTATIRSESSIPMSTRMDQEGSDSMPNKDHGPSSATIVGVLAAVVILLLLVLGGVGVWIWRKKKAKRGVDTYMTLNENEQSTDF